MPAQEMKEVRKKTGAHGDPVELAVALSAAQEQQAQLEQTLSSETKVKMDLFSALGGARRQLQINESEYTYVYLLVLVEVSPSRPLGACCRCC
jgi:hypothetical protein